MAIASFISKLINDTDANFRLWGSGLSNAIQAVGLIKTSDTGQINWSTVTRPTVANAMQGYEIYRFNDSLQGTAPIFLKIEYGSGIYGASFPAYKTTVGKGTDGAGNITGVLHDLTQTGAGNSSSSSDFLSYVSSGDGSMLVFTLWPTATTVATHGWRFALERSRDVNGNPTATGTLCYRMDSTTSTTAATTSRTEAADYGSASTNTILRGPVNTGYEIGSATTLNNGINTPMFKAEVVTPSRLKWNPKSILGYAQADAGTLQVVDVAGNNYLTLGGAAGQYADVGQQQYCCVAIAYY